MMAPLSHQPRTACRAAFSVAVTLLLLAASATAAEDRTGEQIYRQQCASCHGNSGEGVKKHYGKPLIGDRSLAELTKLIDKTMPEDAPETCVGPEARKVAVYIYDKFYSPVAQARNQPARIELSRLTVRQYRNAVADLVNSFRWNARWDEERGLRAEYFKSRSFRKEDRVIERVDPGVQFDYGKSSPDPDKIKPEEFSAKWQGGILAPDTGEYEFILNSENGARLWINDSVRPLIDATVKSGSNTEHRESIRLLGGRVYPLRLEFVKSKEAKESSASITLKWKLPHRAPEVIPARNLAPRPCPTVFVVETPFPPDDRSLGYERGTSVSEAWEQATTDAAVEVSDYVLKNLADLSGAKSDAPDRAAKLKEFGYRWVGRAFRRPITDEQKKFFVDRQFENSPDLETAVRRVVLLSLVSPRFLYQEIGDQLDGYDVACRLSFGLWDSLPDQQLQQAAASGKLSTPDQVRRQAERMLPDLRTRSKLHEFCLQWLNVDHFTDLAKDSKRFPEFDEEIESDLRTSLDLLLDDVLWSDKSDFRELLLADWLYLNGRLAKFYGVELPADAPFQKVAVKPGQRAGVLTHPYLMAGFAYTASSSPIHRGVFVARSVLGRALRPPPEAVAPLPADLHKDLTTRQRVMLQTKAEACQSCHRMINPLGFAFENFDAVGRFRSIEQGRPIDSTGVYQTRTGDMVKFTSVRDLANFLSGSEETHEAVVEQLFHYLVKQPIRAFGTDTMSNLEKSFAKNDFNMRKLVVEIMVTSATQGRNVRLAAAEKSSK
jgi:mono/diheme cytochrome c family protein